MRIEEAPGTLRVILDTNVLVAAAYAPKSASRREGRADWIITNDRHLLALDPFGGIRVPSSSTFVVKRPRDANSET